MIRRPRQSESTAPSPVGAIKLSKPCATDRQSARSPASSGSGCIASRGYRRGWSLAPAALGCYNDCSALALTKPTAGAACCECEQRIQCQEVQLPCGPCGWGAEWCCRALRGANSSAHAPRRRLSCCGVVVLSRQATQPLAAELLRHHNVYRVQQRGQPTVVAASCTYSLLIVASDVERPIARPTGTRRAPRAGPNDQRVPSIHGHCHRFPEDLPVCLTPRARSLSRSRSSQSGQ